MRENYKKSSIHLKPAEPSAGLFDRIILAIKREQELQQTRKLLFLFSFLLVVSFAAMPFSWQVLVREAESSGISYFISAAASDFGTFFALWQDFSLAILESLPLTGMIFFVISLGVSVFTLRLFLCRKRLLLGYLMHNFA